MEALVEQGMKDGAWGLATGLIYNPGTYAKTDELIALAKVAARHGGFYASHIRDEGTGLAGLGDGGDRRSAGRRSCRSTSRTSRPRAEQPGARPADAIALVEQARAKGQAVTADQYPYTASSTSLIGDA